MTQHSSKTQTTLTGLSKTTRIIRISQLPLETLVNECSRQCCREELRFTRNVSYTFLIIAENSLCVFQQFYHNLTVFLKVHTGIVSILTVSHLEPQCRSSIIVNIHTLLFVPRLYSHIPSFITNIPILEGTFQCYFTWTTCRRQNQPYFCLFITFYWKP